MLRSDAVERRNQPVQDMIKPVVFMGTLNRSNILRPFHDTDNAAVALRIAADAADLLFCQILTDRAVMDEVLGIENGVCKGVRILLRHLHDRICKALRGFHSDPRQRCKFFS